MTHVVPQAPPYLVDNSEQLGLEKGPLGLRLKREIASTLISNLFLSPFNCSIALSKMRFKASIKNINTFTRLTASLSSLGKDVWLQLNNEQLRFTVVPEQGSQVWAYVLRPSTWLS